MPICILHDILYDVLHVLCYIWPYLILLNLNVYLHTSKIEKHRFQLKPNLYTYLCNMPLKFIYFLKNIFFLKKKKP